MSLGAHVELHLCSSHVCLVIMRCFRSLKRVRLTSAQRLASSACGQVPRPESTEAAMALVLESLHH